MLEGTNPITELNYYTAIAGIPLVEQTENTEVEKVSAQLDGSVRLYREKELTISNQFIQSKVYGQRIADFIIEHFENPVPMVNITTLGVPHLQLGDRVEVTELDQLDMSELDFWIMEVIINYDGGISQELNLRRVS